MTKQKSHPKHNHLVNTVGLDSVNELLNQPIRLAWMNFKTGFLRGFAGVFGAAVAILILGFLVTKLGGLPYIGDFFRSIGDAAKI